jgi:hypothetical protein
MEGQVFSNLFSKNAGYFPFFVYFYSNHQENYFPQSISSREDNRLHFSVKVFNNKMTIGMIQRITRQGYADY